LQVPRERNAVTTILEILKSILPAGCNNQDTGWDTVPRWPPDLFAAVASITERSGLYSDRAFTSEWDASFVCNPPYRLEVETLGQNWRQSGIPPNEVQAYWRELIRNHQNARIDDGSDADTGWKVLVFRLLAIADEACEGVGFPPRAAGNPVPGEPSPPVEAGPAFKVFEEHIAWVNRQAATPDVSVMGGTDLLYMPHSLCAMVPPAVACVQPKASTPSVGCNLRSFTHHVALLPSIGHVTTHWRIASGWNDRRATFNLLIMPFPYSLPGRSFTPVSEASTTYDRAFELDPRVWTESTTPREFADFIVGLIDCAHAEMKTVDAIVLPETALMNDFAAQIAGLLAAETDVELLLTGTLHREDGRTRNSASMFRMLSHSVLQKSSQSKHHRWCLNGDQVKRYHLGNVLDPQARWWEAIDVGYRHCFTTVFRPGAALSVLVCEDLARYDPVLTVMNAIGPNLVIALLMDGPQLEHRWSGRYATSLADDPGSAVLTVTSMGMIARSFMPGETVSREIALWKEPGGKAVALKLPRGDHALLLSLTIRNIEQYTLDGRTDGGSTVRFELGAAHGLRHPTPPSWLGTVP
jgi:hypothetical protein